MTREQEEAREAISLYEGAGRLECEIRDRVLIVTTDTGKRWTVPPHAKRCVRDDGLEVSVDSLWLRIEGADEPADELEDEYRYESRGWGFGVDQDEMRDLVMFRRQQAEDQDHWDRLEAA